MEEIKSIAEFANKRFGQNFLKNERIIGKIVEAIPNDDLRVVEIGSGLGDLTKELILAHNVTAFEVDKRLCEHLNSRFQTPIRQGSLNLKCGDVLNYWGNGKLLNEDYHLVANLPYYIATKIILKALKDTHCQSILVMVQREVAKKFSAKTGEREFSSLAVLTQRVGSATILFDVGAENFVPPPKVTSSVLLIQKDRSEDDRGFERFLKLAFKQPRKKLIKNLATHYPKNEIETLFLELELNPNMRPHEAMTSIYHHLYNELNKDNIDGREKDSTGRATKGRTG